ncbi:hypothetical protein PoB_003746900 [Plakobranchus ocellatus]|uniref:Fibronectin type-III domain-containing protein n=1 Tax=Plakobranchus ocellatus TaxID=259542 RepID=A0AAV4AXV5_9GAST|nr:hypothetical protein PoB_003746900 [Plakobranchus ocellatus]
MISSTLFLVLKDSAEWVSALKDIPDNQNGFRVKALVTGLQPGTKYLMQVVASNVLGNTATEFMLQSDSVERSTSEGLGPGGVVGIVLAVLAVVCIVIFLLYLFVWRKITGEDLVK